MITFLLLACTSSHEPEKKEEKTKTPPPKISDALEYNFKKTTTQMADKVGCADLNGDGVDEEFYFHDGSLYWGKNEEKMEGSFQAFHRGKDFDGKERFLFATGFGKGFRKAKSQLYSLDSSGLKKLWERDGSRNQITTISDQDGLIFFTTFAEGTMVQGGWLKEGFESLGELKMAMSQAPIGDSIVLGRLYGDEPRSFGDLRVRAWGKETFLPTFRGVKSILVHDLNQDSHPDILVSDGWHYQYASQAKGRIRAYLGPDFEDVRTLANFDQDYTINRIEAHRNNKDYLVQASSHVYLLQQTKFGFKSTEISKILETGSAVFCYNKDQTSILISGTPSQLIQLEPTP